MSASKPSPRGKLGNLRGRRAEERVVSAFRKAGHDARLATEPENQRGIDAVVATDPPLRVQVKASKAGAAEFDKASGARLVVVGAKSQRTLIRECAKLARRHVDEQRSPR